YTALTTILAFSSLVFSGIRPVIDFGWMMTIGLSVTFFVSFVQLPAVLVLMKKSGAIYSEDRELTFISKLASVVRFHGGKVLLFAFFCVVISIVGIMKLKVENSFINYFSNDTEIYQGMKLIDDKLGGTTPLDVLVRFDDSSADSAANGSSAMNEEEEFSEEDEFEWITEYDPADYWFTPYKIRRIKEVHDYLDGLPEVGKVLSLASVVRVAEELNQGKEFDGLELGVLYKKIPDRIKSDMVDNYISIDKNEARISLRILDSLQTLRRRELLDRINKYLIKELDFSANNITVTGILVLYNNMLQSLFQSQILTLGIVMLGIAAMLLILFRSFLLSIIGIVPNLLAVAIILGMMGLMNIPLDMMTITIAAITMGIGVDDCIHYIYRFREEFSLNGGDYAKTVQKCHRYVGKAIVNTSITIMFGFSILVMSNFIPTIYFGFFTGLAMVIALLAVLTVLPKLILVWRPFKSW
ncbi:MAG: MMPL family transporter, partial [Proteobacteria bacterium]|nr:MMPL family transporter [Pseudomonadota bacterium]